MTSIYLGGTIRLPRLIGQSRAVDMILTGRPVHVEEALAFGLVNKVSKKGEAVKQAISIAETLCSFPQATMKSGLRSFLLLLFLFLHVLRSDLKSSAEQWSLDTITALRNEFLHGEEVLFEGLKGSELFRNGLGRNGKFFEQLFDAEKSKL